MKKYSLSLSITRSFLVGVILALNLSTPLVWAQGNENATSLVATNNSGLVVKIAPNEKLPIAVRLANFGGGDRVDVRLSYLITSQQGEIIISASETVAVETTANFTKNITLPETIKPGTYTATTSITYQGQLTPADSHFTFKVERKIFGIFQSTFIFYGLISIVLSLLMYLLGHALIKYRRTVRLEPFDYANIPHNQRTFFEILSDTIMEMRERVGDDALMIAQKIPGLTINPDTGRVLGMTDRPSKIIAKLVAEYENVLGKKVSFSLRKKVSRSIE